MCWDGDEAVCAGELGCVLKFECGGDWLAACDGDVMGEGVADADVRLWLYDAAM